MSHGDSRQEDAGPRFTAEMTREPSFAAQLSYVIASMVLPFFLFRRLEGHHVMKYQSDAAQREYLELVDEYNALRRKRAALKWRRFTLVVRDAIPAVIVGALVGAAAAYWLAHSGPRREEVLPPAGCEGAGASCVAVARIAAAPAG